VVKAIWTLPFLWLFFEQWSEKPLRWKLTAHLVTCPIWLGVWLFSFQWVCRLVGLKYLTGRGMAWDIYIPILFYVIQFAIIHIIDEHNRLRTQQKREKELLKLVHETQLSGLKAQLQPHFLFNALNSISASVPAQSEHTRQLIARLADTFRLALHLSQHDFVPLVEEVKFVRACLDLESERMGDRLAVKYQIEPSVMHIPVPSMLLQPLIENALKHGIAPKIEGGAILIKISESAGFLHFEIADTGLGVQNTEGVFERGIGLKNTAKRLKKLYGEAIRLEKNTPEGTKVNFKIPIHD
jgi:LytS/YehU family sensor histidine kinase